MSDPYARVKLLEQTKGQKMNKFEIHEIGTSSFYCENCGEIDYGQFAEILDGFENILGTIDQICIHCLEQYK